MRLDSLDSIKHLHPAVKASDSIIKTKILKGKVKGSPKSLEFRSIMSMTYITIHLISETFSLDLQSSRSCGYRLTLSCL